MNCEGRDQDLPEVASLGSVGPDLLFQKAEPFLHKNWNIINSRIIWVTHLTSSQRFF